MRLPTVPWFPLSNKLVHGVWPNRAVFTLRASHMLHLKCPNPLFLVGSNRYRQPMVNRLRSVMDINCVHRSHYLSTLRNLPEFISACTLQGRRPYQEDRFTIAHLTPELSFLACYDGHGGDEAAEFAQQNLHKYFLKFLNGKSSCADALKEAIVQLDLDFVATGETAGTTVLAVVLKDDHLCVGHVGDSRALLCKEGKVLSLTKDHKPAEPMEQERIEKYGGDVVIDADGTSRVNARLAMSRSVGDREFKQFGVIAEPDVCAREVTDKDCFVVLMTDGVSDVLNDAQICAIVNSCADPEEAAQELVSLAAQLGSMDNITALVMRLSGWGKFENPEDTRLRQQAYTYNRGSRFRPLSML